MSIPSYQHLFNLPNRQIMGRLLPLMYVLLCLPLQTIGQLFEIKEKGKWGLMDTTGKIVLEPQFDYLRPSEDGKYFFTLRHAKTGLFHSTHGELVPPTYDQIFVNQQSEEDLLITVKGKYGVLNPHNQTRIPPAYDEVYFMRPGVYAVKKEKSWGLKSLSGQIDIPTEYLRIITFEEDDRIFYCAYDRKRTSHIWDEEGKAIIENIPFPIHNYLSGVFIYRKNRRFGILGNSREPLTEAKYRRIDPLGLLFRVQEGAGVGLISQLGESILPAKYQEIRLDTSGHYWIRSGKRWGFTDREGKVMMDSVFSQAGAFEGPVSRIRVNRAYGVINESGDYVVEPKYRAVRIYPGLVRYFNIQDSTWAQARFDEQGTPIRQRKLIIAQSSGAYKFMRTRSMQKEEDLLQEFGWFQTKQRWGLRDTISGKLRIKPRFDSVAVHPKHNLSTVGVNTYSQLNARYGIVNHNSARVEIPPIFSKIYLEDLSNSFFVRGIRAGGAYQLLNPGFITNTRSGNSSGFMYSFIGEPQDRRFRVRFRAKNSKAFAPDDPNLEEQLVQRMGIWGIIDADGSLMRQRFTYISPIINNIFRYRSDKLSKFQWGLYHVEEGELLAPTYAHIEDPGEDASMLISRMSGTKYSFLDREGHFLFEKMADSLSKDNRTAVVRRVGNFSEGLLRTQINRFWGYLNQRGELVIDPQFSQAKDFSEGFAVVRNKSGWGFINTEGEWLAKKKGNGKEKIYYFKKAMSFSEGFAPVQKASSWGYANTSGRLQIRPRYRKAEAFQQGLAIVKIKKYGLIDTRGKWVLKPKYDKIEAQAGGYHVAIDGQHGFFSKDRTWIVPPSLQKIEGVHEGKMVFRNQQQYGVMDKKGKVLIEPSFKYLREFSEGLAAARESGKWGFIDEQGTMLIAPQYDRAESFRDGVARVQGGRPRRWGAINAAGDTLLPFIYDRIKHLPGGWLSCKLRDSTSERSRWVYMDTYGIPSHHQDYDSAKSIRGTELAILGRHGKEYVIDVDSSPITNPGYDKILAAGQDVILGQSRGLLGLIDRKGKEIFPPQFEEIIYRDGLYRVHLNGQVGYLNNEGAWIRPLTN